MAGNTFACQFLSGGVGLRKFQNATSINYLEKREKQISKIPILLRDANFVSIDRDEIEVKFWASRKVPLNEEQLHNGQIQYIGGDKTVPIVFLCQCF